jgi:hypothetical protein
MIEIASPLQFEALLTDYISPHFGKHQLSFMIFACSDKLKQILYYTGECERAKIKQKVSGILRSKITNSF